MTRFKAFFIHLLISVVVVGLFVYVVFTLWYPRPLFSIAQVISPIKLLVLIDVVVGPLLTLVVFSKKKSINHLRLDFTFIILLQLSALSYGIYTIYNGRSSIIAFSGGKFNYLIEKHANNQDLQFESLKPEMLAQPKLAYISHNQTFDIYASYGDLEPLTDYRTIEPFALSIETMRAKFKGKVEEIDLLVKKYQDEDIVFFTLDKDLSMNYIVYSKYRNAIIDQLKF